MSDTHHLTAGEPDDGPVINLDGSEVVHDVEAIAGSVTAMDEDGDEFELTAVRLALTAESDDGTLVTRHLVFTEQFWGDVNRMAVRALRAHHWGRAFARMQPIDEELDAIVAADDDLAALGAWFEDAATEVDEDPDDGGDEDDELFADEEDDDDEGGWEPWWHGLDDDLDLTLAALTAGEVLRLTGPGGRWVQVSLDGEEAAHLESVGNQVLPPVDRMSADELDSLEDLGWLAPTRFADEEPEPESSGAVRGPGGSVHHTIDLQSGWQHQGTARFLTLTLRAVHGAAGLDQLTYRARGANGEVILLPGLPLRRTPD